MKLGDVSIINPESISKSYPYSEIEYIEISSVESGILNSTKSLKLENAPSRAKRIVRKDDIVLATVRPNLRSFWYAQNPPANAIASTGFAIIRANNNTSSRFLYYSIINQPFTDYLTANAKGAAYPAVDTETIERAQIYFPPLPTQHKIASILSAYDDLIENNLKRIKILEEMAQNLYREWFVKFRFPGHENTRFVDSPLGRIPEGWEIKRLDQLVSLQNNGTVAGEHLFDRVYLPIDCIPRKSLAISEVKSWQDAQSSLHLFDVGDILFGAMRPYFHKVVISPFKGVTRKTCFVFKSNLPEYHAYAALTLFQDSTISYANAHSRGATIPYAVWAGSLDGMEVVVPDIKLAKQFEFIVGPMINRIGIIFFQNTNLRQTRDLLLPKLISGEVDVTDMEIKIP